jgi:hypothetical protein
VANKETIYSKLAIMRLLSSVPLDELPRRHFVLQALHGFVQFHIAQVVCSVEQIAAITGAASLGASSSPNRW